MRWSFLVVFALMGATLSASSQEDDEYLFDGDTIEDGVEIIGEYDPPNETPWSDSGNDYISDDSGGVQPSPSDVSVIRDPSGSFCVSDSQTGLCIPDPGGPEGDESDEPSGPSIIDILEIIEDQVERDIVRLPVAPARINYQPPSGEVLVNIDTIFYTEASVQYLTTSVLGRAVTIEVTPRWFEWDFGDGTAPLGTSDQGAAYPHHTIAHVYEGASDNFVSLRTTWDARFRVEGISNWIPVSGQPVTVDEVGPIRSVTKTNRLVKTD